MKFIEIFGPQKYFLGEKTVVETNLVVITDSSNVRYFDQYLINIFFRSMKVERYLRDAQKSPNRLYFDT